MTYSNDVLYKVIVGLLIASLTGIISYAFYRIECNERRISEISLKMSDLRLEVVQNNAKLEGKIDSVLIMITSIKSEVTEIKSDIKGIKK